MNNYEKDFGNYKLKVKDLNRITVFMIVVAMDEILELFNYEKIIKKLGIYTPITIYGWLYYENTNNSLFLGMLIITVIISIIHIVNKDRLVSDFGEKIDKQFIKKLRKAWAVPRIIQGLLFYVTFLNLCVAFVFSIYYIQVQFSLILLILSIVSGGTLLYFILGLIINADKIKEIVKRVRKK